MAQEVWMVVREHRDEESPFVGPFTSREEAEQWAAEQERQGRKIFDIGRLDVPVGPSV